MKKNTFRKGIVCILIFCMILPVFSEMVYAVSPVSRNRKTIIKVAFYELDGFFEYDDQGNETGYGVEYLEELAKYGDFEFEYVPCESWSETKEKLVNGEVDIRMPVTKPGNGKVNSETQYSSEYIMSTFYAILVPKSREDLFYGDKEAIANLTLGYEKASMDDVLKETLEDRIDMSKLKEFDDINDCRQAMKSGEIDGIVTNIMDLTYDLKMLDRFYNINNYITTMQGNPLMVEIDEALSELKLEEPSFQMELYAKYYPARVYTPFTKEEEAYLQNDVTVRVGIIDGLKPISYYDSKDGTLKGIVVDLMKAISAVTGLKMELISLGNKNPEEALKNGEVDILVPYEGGKVEDEFFQTKELFHGEIVCVTTENKITLHSESLVGIYAYEDGVAEMIAKELGVRVKSYDSVKEVFAALRHGDVEAIFTNRFIAEYAMNNPRNTELAIMHSPQFLSRITIVGNINDELQGILNKGIQRVSKDTLSDVIEKNILYTWEDMSVMDTVYVYRLLFVGLLIGLFMVAGILQYYINSKKKYILEIEAKSRESEQASRAKTEFLSRMSHEIRTPMNAVIGLASMGARGEIAQEDTKATFGQIQRSGKFLLALINDILDVSKIESGKIEFHEELVHLEEWYHSVVNMIQPLADDKNVVLKTRLNIQGNSGIYMDEMRMKQVVVNLLNNAIKFSEPGDCVAFRLDCTPVGEGKSHLILQVEDEGCGMSEAFQEKMYEPFEQEAGGLATTVKGTGLGLSIVKRLIDQMGGAINCDSRLNEGTVFTIEVDKKSSKWQESPVKKEEIVPKQIRVTGKVLLVEDNDINAIVVEKMLSTMGFSYVWAKNGKEAVETFKDAPDGTFQLILMDIRMPVMDGLQATTAIRSLKKSDAATIPIIALTADAFDGDKMRCVNAGMNDHLAKPLEMEELKKLLMKWCGGN